MGTRIVGFQLFSLKNLKYLTQLAETDRTLPERRYYM